jgi:ABC-type lipoprotein release transport system permease subunit
LSNFSTKLALYPAFLKSLVFGKSNGRFLVGVILGFSFSIAVILSTIGLMDGFEKLLRLNIKGQEGDISVHSRNGFFPESALKNSFEEVGVDTAAFVVLTEGFAISEASSKAVLIMGIDNEEYSRLIDRNTMLGPNEIIVGKVLAKDLGLDIGSDLTIAFAEGNREFTGLPALRHFKVKEIREHPLYQKDQRFILMGKTTLQNYLNAKNLVNLAMAKVPLEFTLTHQEMSEGDRVTNFLTVLDERLDVNYISRPYWHDFKTLIEAVQIEKVMIGLILQIIVVIAILNVVAFIIFINEKKSKELF